ncbi:MAG TPA: hypothetical protein VFQ63_02350 [Patescibacteria group bacterium]|nr:hypothetical protein [Patescibacteria group bacterium]
MSAKETAVIPESPLTPEQKVSRLVNMVDKGLIFDFGEKREPNLRQQACDFSIALVKRAFEREAESDDAYKGIALTTYQTSDVHLFFGETDEEVPFSHGITVVDVEGKPFLIDLTFCQFMNPDGGPLHEGRLNTSVSSATPLAQELLANGFIALTEENLREYLRLTTKRENPSYLQKVTLAGLQQAPTVPLDFSDYYHGYELWELDECLDA